MLALVQHQGPEGRIRYVNEVKEQGYLRERARISVASNLRSRDWSPLRAYGEFGPRTRKEERVGQLLFQGRYLAQLPRREPLIIALASFFIGISACGIPWCERTPTRSFYRRCMRKRE